MEIKINSETLNQILKDNNLFENESKEQLINDIEVLLLAKLKRFVLVNEIGICTIDEVQRILSSIRKD